MPLQVPQGYCDSYQFSRGLASSPFKALNSECLSSCQKNVRPALKMRRGPRVCFRVSTGDSDTFHLVRRNTSLHSSHCKETGLLSSHVISVSIPLEAANSGPSHIPIVERSVLLVCCRNLEFLLSRSQGNSSHLEMIWCTWSFPRFALLNSVFL